MAPEAGIVFPNWALPEGVHCCLTNRLGGFSLPPFDQFNLGEHTGDVLQHVSQNRLRLQQNLGLDHQPVWLSQVHGRQVHRADGSINFPVSTPIEADASYTNQAQTCLAIMVADCLPILISSVDGLEIAAVHAGWKGLANGIIGETIARFTATELLVWLGPCIGPCHYEVDDLLRDQFESKRAFSSAGRQGHWMFDLRAEARGQLKVLGINEIAEIEVCTHCDQDYYSYRRDGQTGRFAALIWRHL